MSTGLQSSNPVWFGWVHGHFSASRSRTSTFTGITASRLGPSQVLHRLAPAGCTGCGDNAKFAPFIGAGRGPVSADLRHQIGWASFEVRLKRPAGIAAALSCPWDRWRQLAGGVQDASPHTDDERTRIESAGSATGNCPTARAGCHTWPTPPGTAGTPTGRSDRPDMASIISIANTTDRLMFPCPKLCSNGTDRERA